MKVIDYGSFGGEILDSKVENLEQIKGGEDCALQVCGGNICGVDVCQLDLCGIDACAGDIISFCPVWVSPF